MTVLYVLSSIGGATAFFAAIAVLVKAGFEQANALKDNTDAVHQLTTNLTKLTQRVDSQGEDIAYLKGKASNG